MPDLEYIFHPKSIAIVGASTNPFSAVNHFFLDPLIDFGYEGNIYPIHPKASELSGLKVYPSILDVPGPVDHVTCGIRATLTPQLMRECVAKKVKVVHLFTSGFSEIGREQGLRLEKEITEIARQGNIRVLGPNCMGIYCPSSKFSYESSFPKESGNVGFLAQSGGNSVEIVQLGDIRDVRFSKLVSYGNASDINEADLLEYFANDPQTKIIIGYIEGTHNGRRFASALQKAAAVKPVIILKGGITKSGVKVAASHTGSLAGSAIIWDSLFRKLGVIQVESMPELVDLVLLFQHLQPPRGRRIGLLGGGGGSSVLIADSCEKEGILIPPFPDELKKRIREIIPEEADPGTTVRNPVDLSYSGSNPDFFGGTFDIVANYDGIDFLLVFTNVDFGFSDGTNPLLTMQTDIIIKRKEKLNKPMALVLRRSGDPKTAQFASDIQHKCLQAGIPVFASFNEAAHAINKFIRYYRK